MAILDDIYDAVVDDEALARLPAALARKIGSRSCLIQLLDPGGRLVNLEFNYFSPANMKEYRQKELYKFDTWAKIGMSPGVFGFTVNVDQYISDEDYLTSTCYNEIFRPWGDDTGKLIGFCRPLDDHILTVGLQRGLGDKAFEAGHLGRLRSISDHLSRAFAARQALARANSRALQLTAALDAPLIGIVRVDIRGRLVHANSAGQELLRLQDGFALVGQTVAVQTPAVQPRFAEAIRAAAQRSGNQGDALLVPRPSGRPPWRVIVAPDEAQASGHATLLVESSGGEGGLRAHLTALYGLTQAESEVAVLLAEGFAPAEIADQRSVSIETVRNQIKALLQKTGANRIGGLIALLARTVRTRASW
jgi:DNA-binding CsgD family transcriptional regulator